MADRKSPRQPPRPRGSVRSVPRAEVEALRTKPEDSSVRRRREDWALSSVNPNRAIALAMRGLPTEDFTSPRGWNMVDAVRHFTPEHWRRFTAFYSAKEKGELKGESYSKGWDIFVEAWGWIVARLRNGELIGTAIAESEVLPKVIHGDSWGQVQLTGFDTISQSVVVIHGHRFVDARFHSAKDALAATTGERGRPSSKAFYLGEATARATRGELSPSMAEEVFGPRCGRSRAPERAVVKLAHILAATCGGEAEAACIRVPSGPIEAAGSGFARPGTGDREPPPRN